MRNLPFRVRDLLWCVRFDHGIKHCGRKGFPSSFDLLRTRSKNANIVRHDGLRYRLDG